MLHTLKNPEALRKAFSLTAPVDGPVPVKLLFVPPHLTESNRDQFIRAYSSIYGLKFEVVVVVEDVAKVLEKRISMPDFEEILSVFGPVGMHDGVRNEFADEDDDLYVDNGGVHNNMAIFHQLPFLQASIDEFQVVSVQIHDNERPSIIKELAYVIEEILGERAALIVFCCDLDASEQEAFQRLMEYVDNQDTSNLFNSLNSGAIPMKGRCPFITGMLVAKSWNLGISFETLPAEAGGNSLVCGTASFALRTANA